jgi:aspartate/methionine/tyrosine aminotransferase
MDQSKQEEERERKEKAVVGGKIKLLDEAQEKEQQKKDAKQQEIFDKAHGESEKDRDTPEEIEEAAKKGADTADPPE